MPRERTVVVSSVSRTGATAPEETDPGEAATEDHTTRNHWLARDPVRTGFLLVLAITLGIRFSIIKDAFFYIDDYAFTTKAVEDFGWGYLTTINAGHFAPFTAGVMWLLAHVAPWNWGATAVLLILGELVVAVLVWRLLTELFGRRLLVLVPFGLYCLSPLTVHAYTWLAAALSALPLTAALAGALRHHARYLRLGNRRDVAYATLWVLLGMASFEKIVIYFPFVVVMTLALSPGTFIRPRPLLDLFKRTWLIWVSYLATAFAFVIVYLTRSGPRDGTPLMVLPSPGEFWDFANISLLRTFVPGVFGGPWAWTPTTLASSPRAFEWICWVLALCVITGTLMVRHRIGRVWASLGVYLLCSFFVVALGRLQFGQWSGLVTRYLSDAVLPLSVVVGMCLMPLRGEANTWLPLARSLSARLSRPVRVGVGSAAALVVVALAIHSLSGFATVGTANPFKAFVLTAQESLTALPANAQVYDTPLPRNVVGPLFGRYNLTSRFMAPVATAERRHEMYTLTRYTNPYFLAEDGRFVPMTVAGMKSPAPPPAPPGQCAGWTPQAGVIAVPLTGSAYDWTWTVRVGYLAAGDTQATIVLGRDRERVQLHTGLGEIFLPMIGGGDEVRVEDMNADANVCVGDVQVGKPAPK
jgi:hypothetical protein